MDYGKHRIWPSFYVIINIDYFCEQCVLDIICQLLRVRKKNFFSFLIFSESTDVPIIQTPASKSHIPIKPIVRNSHPESMKPQ